MKDVEISVIEHILVNKCKLCECWSTFDLLVNQYCISWTGYKSVQIYVHLSMRDKVAKVLNNNDIKSTVYTSKHSQNKCISIKNVKDIIIIKPDDLLNYVQCNASIEIETNAIHPEKYSSEYKSIPILKKIKKIVHSISPDCVIIPNRYFIAIIPLSDYIKWAITEYQWKLYAKEEQNFKEYCESDEVYVGYKAPKLPITEKYSPPKINLDDVSIFTLVLNKLNDSGFSTLTTSIDTEIYNNTDDVQSRIAKLPAIILINDEYDIQWMVWHIKETELGINRASTKIKKGIKKNQARINDIKKPEQYVIKFGKYKGSKITDMKSPEQLQYCSYMLKQMYAKSEEARRIDAFYLALKWHKINVMNDIIYNDNDFNIDDTKEIDPTGVILNFGKFKGRSLESMTKKEEVNYLNWFLNILTENIKNKESRVNNFYYSVRKAYKNNKEIYDNALRTEAAQEIIKPNLSETQTKLDDFEINKTIL